MTTLYLRKAANGLIPDTESDGERMKRFRIGEVVKAEVTRPRNIRFFRKWWALVKVGYELWEELCPPHEYRGQPVLPEFDRFRRDVTILAGFARPVINVQGELRLEPESIAFGSMDEDRFEDLYNATINALLNKVLKNTDVDEKRLRMMADQIVEFT